MAMWSTRARDALNRPQGELNWPPSPKGGTENGQDAALDDPGYPTPCPQSDSRQDYQSILFTQKWPLP
jgi:hypothetical protein